MTGAVGVVLALGAEHEAVQTGGLANGFEALAASGEQLVDIGVMADGENEPVPRGVEDIMKRQRQFNDAEIRAEMSSGFRQGENQTLANFLRKGFKLRDRKLLDVCRRVDGVE